MKRNFTLLLGLGLSVLAGCSKEYAGSNDNGALVPIELGVFELIMVDSCFSWFKSTFKTAVKSLCYILLF